MNKAVVQKESIVDIKNKKWKTFYDKIFNAYF